MVQIKHQSFIGVGLCLVLGTPQYALATILRTELVASGFNRPVYVTAARGDTDRLFVVENHTGDIKILNLNTGMVNPNPFLTVSGISNGNEQGLLGLAFHPNYATNGHFFVNFTGAGGATNIRRYTVSPGDPSTAQPSSAMTVMSYSQPFSNHNGGWIGFGEDNNLYIASGDGGRGNDPGNRAQDISNQKLGKILRIDVDGDDFPGDAGANYRIPESNPFVQDPNGDDEIWAFGLRNPWRASFDRETGDFYIADVGQNAREEVNFQPASSAGGENYGWRLREGTIATPGVGGAPPPGAVDPIYDYPHGFDTGEGNSVTGGYVYRGPIEALQGKYFFADYVSEQIWSIEHDGTEVTEFIDWTTLLDPEGELTIDQIASFGEDAQGNLYIVDLGGEIFRVSAVPLPAAAWMFVSAMGVLGLAFRSRTVSTHSGIRQT